ncbi:MAG TPA: serine/threonine-protein kinase [Phycisphaerae bacterium]|nr:serine/threonine-protein kinase [Phycisphaerae bacterium]
MPGCLTEVELFRAYRGELSAGAQLEALRHVIDCSLCQEQWKHFELDSHVARSVRSALLGDLRGADNAPGVNNVTELPERLDMPGFRMLDGYIDGGQARVFHAMHLASQEEVAIKVFHNSPLNEGGHARFLRELRSLARLRHPNVIPIRSAGEIMGFAYYVMPWICGDPLDVYARKARLSTARKVDLLIRVVSAVEHAHKRGVLHLDLKPTNVRVDAAGEPIVMDFGLARMSSSEFANLAGLGLGAVGTPAYMAPEQVEDREDVDTRADVFMLGLLMFEVLTGRRARDVDEDGPTRVITLARTRPPAVRTVAPEVPRELAAIVARATAEDRERRFPSAESMLADLQAYRAGHVVEAMGDGFFYRASKFSRQHLGVIMGTLSIIIILSTALLVRRETLLYAEEAYTRATRVSRERLPATLRELARAYAELASVNEAAGNADLAEDYRLRAEAAARAAATGVDDEVHPAEPGIVGFEGVPGAP